MAPLQYLIYFSLFAERVNDGTNVPSCLARELLNALRFYERSEGSENSEIRIQAFSCREKRV